MADYYSRAVKHFVKNPQMIYEAWISPGRFPGSELFAFVTKSRRGSKDRNGVKCGCVATIQNTDSLVAATAELTELIRNSKHRVIIPRNYGCAEVELKRFATWQRLIDKELGRKTPKWETSKTD